MDKNRGGRLPAQPTRALKPRATRGTRQSHAWASAAAHLHICMYVFISHVYTFIIYTHTYIYIYIHIYIHTYKYIYILQGEYHREYERDTQPAPLARAPNDSQAEDRVSVASQEGASPTRLISALMVVQWAKVPNS